MLSFSARARCGAVAEHCAVFSSLVTYKVPFCVQSRHVKMRALEQMLSIITNLYGKEDKEQGGGTAGERMKFPDFPLQL